MPFTGDHFKSFCFCVVCLSHGLTDGSRINTVCNLPSGFLFFDPCIGKGYSRIRA
ncbi:MAG: hypothetical protein A4E58_00121 [Syntrophorhabdus sp. PtaB.Bin006]|nr:MAG: hypothetical protein A4E58_00121 [Syntrophorhabdus sp. PtaB.Bin006]